jgi:hypothetical protein
MRYIFFEKQIPNQRLSFKLLTSDPKRGRFSASFLMGLKKPSFALMSF